MRMKWKLCLIAALALCILLCACGENGGEPAVDSTTAPVETAAPETEPPDLALNDFMLIRPENAGDDAVVMYADFYKELRGLGDVGIKLSDDYIQKDKEPDSALPEILCGLTNRPESAEALAALPGYYDYSVGTVGNKLCLAANTDAGLKDAITYLMANLEMKDGTLFYTGGKFIGRRDYPAAHATLGGEAIDKYTIVYAAGQERERRTAEKLAVWFAEQTGVMPAVAADSEPEQKNEIILGKTARAASTDPASLAADAYLISVNEGKLLLSAGAFNGYTAIMERMVTLMSENKLTAAFEEKGNFTNTGLDGARVMFIGNSFLYYGKCVSSVATKNKIIDDDQGYFKQVAAAMGDDVYVTAVTWGGAGFTSLYKTLTTQHPNHYGAGGEMDKFYDQDFVVLQQEGSNASSTYQGAKDIMALFPPTTKFGFFIHHHNAQNNHSNVLKAAEKLRDEEGVVYIPAGHLMYETWIGKTKVPDATLKFNKNTFVVNWNDSHHPNYLNGYLVALSTYYAFSGKSILDVPHDFVQTTKEYYTKAPSNYDEVLASEVDMRGLKQLVEQYVKEYN